MMTAIVYLTHSYFLQVEKSDINSLENGVKSNPSAPEFLEKEPVGLVPGIEIKNLKKVFSTEIGMTAL